MNIFKTLFAISVTAAVMLVSGCNLTDDGKETVVKVTPEFTVDLFEELKESRNFQLLIRTIEPQPCINNTIDFTAYRHLSQLSLSIHEILEAADCIEGEERVGANAGFGYLSNGTYDVRLNLKNTIVNEGLLKVTKEAYQLNMSTKSGYELIRESLFRIPDNFIWGYVGYDNQANAAQNAADFLTEINGMTTDPALTKGYYGYFTINDDRVAVLKTPPPFSYFKTFYRQTDGNMEAIKDVLEAYRSGSNADLMEIKLFTWDGKVL